MKKCSSFKSWLGVYVCLLPHLIKFWNNRYPCLLVRKSIFAISDYLPLTYRHIEEGRNCVRTDTSFTHLCHNNHQHHHYLLFFFVCQGPGCYCSRFSNTLAAVPIKSFTSVDNSKRLLTIQSPSLLTHFLCIHILFHHFFFFFFFHLMISCYDPVWMFKTFKTDLYIHFLVLQRVSGLRII